MPADPQPDSAERSRLPFEPAKNRKKPVKEKATPAVAASKSEPELSEQAIAAKKAETTIPKVVSQRMARRMGLFCGIPTTLGMLVFIASYWIVSQGIYKLPTIAVVFVSMGCFGLGVLGLSYGVLSASWDEDDPGSKLGWSEFNTNFGRMSAAWRASKQKNS